MALEAVTGFCSNPGRFYTFVISFIEGISVLAFVGTIIFLSRRNLLKLPRFQSAEMKGWPFRDGNLILIFEILLLIGIFSMNGADTVLQSMNAEHYPDTGKLLVSSWFGPAVLEILTSEHCMLLKGLAGGCT